MPLAKKNQTQKIDDRKKEKKVMALYISAQHMVTEKESEKEKNIFF